MQAARLPLLCTLIGALAMLIGIPSAGAFTFDDDDGDGWLCVCDYHPSCNREDNGTITVTATGFYDLYTDGVELDSMDGQFNESFHMLVENSMNPSGDSITSNCSNGSLYVVADVNPGAGDCSTHTTTLVTRFVGRFLLVAGEVNQVRMLHFCPEARNGLCNEHENGPGPCGTSCWDTSPQSVCINLNAGVTPTDFCPFTCWPGDDLPCATSCGSTGTTPCEADGCGYGLCFPPEEACNGVDDDCDGVVDEDCWDDPPCTGSNCDCDPVTDPGCDESPGSDASVPICTGDLNCQPCETGADCAEGSACMDGFCETIDMPVPGASVDTGDGEIHLSGACACAVAGRSMGIPPAATVLLLLLLAATVRRRR